VGRELFVNYPGHGSTSRVPPFFFPTALSGLSTELLQLQTNSVLPLSFGKHQHQWSKG
jgi:hypothetical protein